MSTNTISNQGMYQITNFNNNKANTKPNDKEQIKNENSNNTSAIYESSKTPTYEKKVSSYENKRNLNLMVIQAERQTRNFETLVSSIFQKQNNKVQLVSSAQNNNLKSFFSNLKVDAKTIAKAKEDISENGYYGVKQTSERILGFAKAVAGDDPKKIEEMRKAVEKGFKQVEKMWGDKLPEISQQTYDKVMATFDKWQGKSEE